MRRLQIKCEEMKSTVEVLCFHRVYHDVQVHVSKRKYLQLDSYSLLFPETMKKKIISSNHSSLFSCYFLMFTIMTCHCPVCCFRFNSLPIRTNQYRWHQTKTTVTYENYHWKEKLGIISWINTLSNDIWLYISIVILTCPNKTTTTFQCLCHHI